MIIRESMRKVVIDELLRCLFESIDSVLWLLNLGGTKLVLYICILVPYTAAYEDTRALYRKIIAPYSWQRKFRLFSAIIFKFSSSSELAHRTPHKLLSKLASLNPKLQGFGMTYYNKVKMFGKVSRVFNRVNEFSMKYPVVRGMVSYGTIWPTGCFLQQIIAGDEKFDYSRAARFSLYGCFYVAPTINTWLTIARTIWPKNDIKSAVIKAVVEQVSYTPFAMVSFYFGMSLLEGKSVEAAKEEVHAKFLPTYKVGALVWPVLQTVNYTLVPEHNRIPFVSLCSLMWSSFLAYMNRQEKPS